MSKKVLVISQYFLPDINAASYRMHDLYNALQKQGINATVVTAYPQKSVVEKVQKDLNIHRLTLKKVEKKSFINYIRNYFGFMFKSILYAVFRLRKEKFDYIFVTSPPLFVALGGYIVACLKRSKLIVDIRDIWPDSAVSTGMLKSNGLLYKLTKRLEKFIYRRADIITAVSIPMKNDIYEKSNHPNIQVLYNGVSPDSFDYALPMPITESMKRKEKISIAYAGNIGIVQNIKILLDVGKQMKEQGLDSFFEFIIIGDGIERKSLEEQVESEDIMNIKFTGPLSKNDTLHQLSYVDCLFFSLIDDPIFETTIPSKLFDYLLSNKPIITSIKGEGRKILKELNCALFFEAEDPSSLLDALEMFREKKQELDVIALDNKQYVIDHFNRESIFSHFFKNI